MASFVCTLAPVSGGAVTFLSILPVPLRDHCDLTSHDGKPRHSRLLKAPQLCAGAFNSLLAFWLWIINGCHGSGTYLIKN